MQVFHSLPAREARAHTQDLDCPCGPSQSVRKRPGAQPVVTITHHTLPKDPR